MNNSNINEKKSYFYTPDKFLYFLLALIVPIFMVKYVHEPMTQKYGFTSIIYFLIVLFLAVRFFKRKDDIEVNVPVQWVAWLLLAIVSFVSIIPATKINLSYSFHTFEVSMFFIATMVISLHIINFSDKRNVIDWIMMFFIISGFLVALDALTNFYYGYDFFLNVHFSPFDRSSVKSTIGNPNFVSDYLATLLPITVYFIIYAGKNLFYKVDKFLDLIVRVFVLVNAVFYLAVIMISQTRGTWLAAMIGWGIFIVSMLIVKFFKKIKMDYTRSAKIWLTIFAFLVIAVVLIYSNNNIFTQGRISVTKRFETINSQFLSAETDTSKQRIMAWTSAWREFKMSPILGTGVGTYKFYTNYALGDIQKDKPTFIASWKNYNRAHNDYIQTLSEMGVFGFSMLLFVIATLIYGFVKVLRTEENSEKITLFLLLITGALVSTIHSTVSFPLHLSPNSLLYTFLLSIIFGKYLYPSKKIKISAKKAKLVIVVLLIAVMLPAMYGKVSAWASETLFVKGNYDLQYSQSYYQAFNQTHDKKYLEDSLKHYEEAYNELEGSLKWDPAFGKTYFYMGNLTSAQARYATFLTKSRVNLSVLKSDKRLYSIIRDYIHDPLDNEINVLKGDTEFSSTLSYLRIFIDSTNAWLTSLDYLVDKNTFRILAQRYSTLATISFDLYSSYSSKGFKNIANERLKRTYEYAQKSIYYLDKAAYIMPGWRNLKDWYDFYNVAFEVSLTDYSLESKVHSIDSKYKDTMIMPFIVNLARMRIWVADEMKMKNDIDSVVFKYLPQMSQSMREEVLGMKKLTMIKPHNYDILLHRPKVSDDAMMIYEYSKYYKAYSLKKQSEILDSTFDENKVYSDFKSFKEKLNAILPAYTKLAQERENSAYTIGSDFNEGEFSKLQREKDKYISKLNSIIDYSLKYRAFYAGNYYYYPKTREVKFSVDSDLSDYTKKYVSKYFGMKLSDNDVKNYLNQFYIKYGFNSYINSQIQIDKANETLKKILKLYQ